MDDLRNFYEWLNSGDNLIQGVLSNVKKGVQRTYDKVVFLPIELKGERVFHVAYHYPQKVMHENISLDGFLNWIESQMGGYFKQGVFFTVDQDVQILFNKKGNWHRINKPPTKNKKDLSHNRRKQYLIPDGKPCDFMVRLGIMDINGQVIPKKYDKFRQLNKYLEFVKESLSEFAEHEVIRIVDFGCGKAYLTFALYFYLVRVLQRKVEIVGLDLKEDVIEFCNVVASDLAYDGLVFQKGDIETYHTNKKVDMVVSLHACDTATDAALEKAVAWKARVIFAVPCCQHELFKQLSNEAMAPMLAHGILKDKLTAIVTDSLRAVALEVKGYDVQVIEFIDLAHTPKNVLIRGFLRKKDDFKIKDSRRAFEKLKNQWGVKPSIERMIDTPNDI